MASSGFCKRQTSNASAPPERDGHTRVRALDPNSLWSPEMEYPGVRGSSRSCGGSWAW